MSQPIPNPNWSRWIYVSLANHYDQIARKSAIPFYIEGQSRPSSIADFGELRVDGPYYNLINRNLWKIDILSSVLVQVVRDDRDKYKLQRLMGVFTSAFHLDIPVFKYGEVEDIDNGTQFGCLSLSRDTGQRIRTTQFGQVQAATPIAEASIEADYRMLLTRSYEDGSD